MSCRNYANACTYKGSCKAPVGKGKVCGGNHKTSNHERFADALKRSEQDKNRDRKRVNVLKESRRKSDSSKKKGKRRDSKKVEALSSGSDESDLGSESSGSSVASAYDSDEGAKLKAQILSAQAQLRKLKDRKKTTKSSKKTSGNPKNGKRRQY